MAYYKAVDYLINTLQNQVIEIFGSRVAALFKIGSLGAHGGFTLCSDFDVALMLDTVMDQDEAIIKILCNALKGLSLPFADRLSLFYSSYDPTEFASGRGRFPALDRLDFLKYGVILAGVDQRAHLPEPTHQEIVLESAQFISDFMLTEDKVTALTQSSDSIVAQGARYFSKFVLFPVRLLYTLDDPDKVGSNEDALKNFRVRYGKLPQMTAVVSLVEAAFAARDLPQDEKPVLPDTMQVTLAISLRKLYVLCISSYIDAVKVLGAISLAIKLEAEFSRIQQ